MIFNGFLNVVWKCGFEFDCCARIDFRESRTKCSIHFMLNGNQPQNENTNNTLVNMVRNLFSIQIIALIDSQRFSHTNKS